MGCRKKRQPRRKCTVSQPNIKYIMNVTKDYLSGKIDGIAYHLDFPYELDKRYKKTFREDDDYCDLIYEFIIFVRYIFNGISDHMHHASLDSYIWKILI